MNDYEQWLQGPRAHIANAALPYKVPGERKEDWRASTRPAPGSWPVFLRANLVDAEG